VKIDYFVKSCQGEKRAAKSPLRGCSMLTSSGAEHLFFGAVARPDPRFRMRRRDYYATYALVAAWVNWAKSQGYWLARNSDAARGDIVIFNWFNGGDIYDHIGVGSSFTPGSSSFWTSEGNSGNRTMNQTRGLDNRCWIYSATGDRALVESRNLLKFAYLPNNLA
jgi:hypothetical protein